MDARHFDGLTRDLSNVSNRRSIIKTIGALAAGGVGLVGLGRAASARNDPRNDIVDKRCLSRCQEHNNGDNGNCHQRCRRDRRR